VTHETNTGRTSVESHSCSAAMKRHGYVMSFARAYNCAVTIFGRVKTWIVIVISYQNLTKLRYDFWNIKKFITLNAGYLPDDIHWYMKIIRVYVGLQLGPQCITTKHEISQNVGTLNWRFTMHKHVWVETCNSRVIL
jgi:hypothetical protein